jgi:hypothetical protein
MSPIDPPIRVGPSIAPPAPASAVLAIEGRIAPGSLTVGQEVAARVLSDRAGGRFLALIDGRQVEVVLPPGARAGDTVRLTVTAEQPRLVLSGRGEARAGVAAGPQGAAAVPAGLPSASGLAASDVSLSASGRGLTRLVADLSAAAAGASAADANAPAADAAGPDAVGPRTTPAAPLIARPAGGRAELAGQLAGALARTFSGSGLFYESHQAQWVAGERSLDSLRQEPQGRLPPLPAVMAGALDAARMASAGLREPTAPPQPMSAPPQGSIALAGVVDPASASLVQQQLATLDAGSAGWTGLVLPGMPARIAVQERPRPSGEETDATPEAAADWSTTVSVTLPRLGTIDARLLLRGDRVMLSVAAGEGSGADELAGARQQLLDALAAAGLRVDALQVEGR